MQAKLGIVAGSGDLPRVMVQACRRIGRPHFVVALTGYAEADLVRDAPHAWYRLGRAGTMIDELRRQGCVELVIVGGVPRPTVTHWVPDWRTVRFIFGRRIWRLGDGGVLNAMIDTLERDEGFRVVGPETVEPDLLATVGPLGRHGPDAVAARDVAIGLAEALALGTRDLGQGVVVRAGKVSDREDRHGTDALLARCRIATSAGRRDGVLVKMARPAQDRRVDLPAVGVRTVQGAAAAGLAGIAVEAGGALIVDRPAVAEAADRAGLFVIGVAKEQAARAA